MTIALRPSLTPQTKANNNLWLKIGPKTFPTGKVGGEARMRQLGAQTGLDAWMDGHSTYSIRYRVVRMMAECPPAGQSSFQQLQAIARQPAEHVEFAPVGAEEGTR